MTWTFFEFIYIFSEIRLLVIAMFMYDELQMIWEINI